MRTPDSSSSVVNALPYLLAKATARLPVYIHMTWNAPAAIIKLIAL